MSLELIPGYSMVCKEAEFEAAVAGPHQDIYVEHGMGYLRHMKLVGGRFVRIKVDKLPMPLPTVTGAVLKEELNFLPAGKVPGVLFDQIVELFRQVVVKFKEEVEAHVWILWNPERGYFISVPTQTVTKASVSFTYDDESLPPGSVIAVDIH